MGPDDLAPLFPMELILQEVSTEHEIPIPEPVREVFQLWRPSPLYRAHRLEKLLGTPARIFMEALRCKAEGRSETMLFDLCGHGHFDMSAYSA